MRNYKNCSLPNTTYFDICKSFFAKCAILPGLLLFFIMMFVPTKYQMAKAVLLGMTLVFIFGNILIREGKIRLHRFISFWMLFYIILGLFWILIGVINNTPGALRVFTVYVLWPLIFTVLISGVSTDKILSNLTKILIISLIAIGIYDLSYILYAYGWLPKFLYIPIDQGQIVGFYSGFVEFRLYNISSLLFLVPFCIAALFVWPDDSDMPISRKWLWISFVLGMILVFLSGRRALLGVVAISPFITLIFKYFLPRKDSKLNRKKLIRTFIGLIFILFGIYIYLYFFYGFNLQSLIKMFLEGFDFQHSGSAIARKTQFYALLEGWSKYPLFGAGHGAGVSYLRSTKQPWAYELCYVALLYQTGLIGFLAYSSGIILMFWKGINMIRSGHFLGIQTLPVLVGTVCFLVGNATNPYLGKFDYMWVIFLPLAFINLWLLKGSKLNE